MNILYLTNHLNIGGISRYIFLLSKGLLARGHKVYIASQEGELKQDFINLGCEFIPLSLKSKSELNPRIILAFFKLAKWLKNKNIDILHANTRITSFISFLLSKYYRIPYLTTCHGLYKIRLTRRLLPFVGQSVIAVSEEVKNQLKEGLKIKEDKIEIIYNGIDLEYFSEEKSQAERKKWNLEENSFIIGNISRLERIKGQHTLILAMPYILKKIPSARLILIGEGKDKGFLEKEVMRLNICPYVRFLGAIKDIRPILRIMDVFCFVPSYEPFGICLLEAMAAKLPIIASSVSSIPYILEEGKAGILIPPQREDLIAKAIIDIFYNQTKAKELAKYAYERVHFFSYQKMAEETLRVYEKILKSYLT